jgi:hypothetical protein
MGRNLMSLYPRGAKQSEAYTPGNNTMDTTPEVPPWTGEENIPPWTGEEKSYPRGQVRKGFLEEGGEHNSPWRVMHVEPRKRQGLTLITPNGQRATLIPARS